MHQLNHSLLIVLEGIDGSGKTLLCSNLSKALSKQLPVVLTKEPGGSSLGKYLRTILQDHPVDVCPKAEFLLYAADRAQHFNTTVLPALAQNKLVISDRMADSSIVYQGFGRGLDIPTIQTVNKWAMCGIQPDLTLYVRIDAQTARERMEARTKLSVFDQKPLSFFEKIIEGFETLYQNRQDVIILDGKLPPEELLNVAKDNILTWIKVHNTDNAKQSKRNKENTIA